MPGQENPKWNVLMASEGEQEEAGNSSSSDSGSESVGIHWRPWITVTGLLLAVAVSAVLLQAWRYNEGEGRLQSNYSMRGGGISQLDAADSEWDESKGALAQEASGLAGMSPTQDILYTGKIGDWNGKMVRITSIHDVTTPGRHCRKHEELFLGICYRNCSILTNNTYPIRFAPNGCCRQMPCLTPSEVDLQGFAPSYGYFVGGEGAGHFPHAPGECMGNEESHLGFCYKKCSLLTNHKFNHRMGTNTCCKHNNCLSPFNWNPFNMDTKGTWCKGYAVGGGLSEGDECPHKPSRAGGPSSR